MSVHISKAFYDCMRVNLFFPAPPLSADFHLCLSLSLPLATLLQLVLLHAITSYHQHDKKYLVLLSFQRGVYLHDRWQYLNPSYTVLQINTKYIYIYI